MCSSSQCGCTLQAQQPAAAVSVDVQAQQRAAAVSVDVHYRLSNVQQQSVWMYRHMTDGCVQCPLSTELTHDEIHDFDDSVHLSFCHSVTDLIVTDLMIGICFFTGT